MIDFIKQNKSRECTNDAVSRANQNTESFAALNMHQEETEIKYSQDWPLYDKANRREKLMFFRILKAAIEHLELKYAYAGNGRPRAFLSDVVKALCIKSYHGYSSWRCESELNIAKSMGIIDQVPKRATLNKYNKDPKVTAILQDLIGIIAEPLALVEITFAADATGISKSYGNSTWKKVRFTAAEEEKRRDYVKLHIITGCKTNVICVAKITKGTAHESPFLKELLQKTARTFKPQHVCADAGYLSHDNVNFIRYKLKAKPWIMPKSNSGASERGRMSAWNSVLHLEKTSGRFRPLLPSEEQC